MSRKLLPILVIVAASVILAWPVLRFGLPYGHDAIEHLSWYRCFATQLWSGEMYPRWLQGMNSGLGSPSLFVYGPIPYYAAAMIRFFTPGPGWESLDLGISLWIALGLSGLAAYLWLKDMVDGRLAAVVAAVIYLLVPYHLKTDLYTRSAVPEFWAFVWMPLILYFTGRLIHQRTRFALAGLSVSYALLICTHLFTTLMFSAIPLVYAGVLVPPTERVRAIGKTALGLALGMTLSAVYLLPALAYQKYISPYKLIESNPETYSFNLNFLFSPHVQSSQFLSTLSLLTAWTAVVAAGFFIVVVLSKRDALWREGMFWGLVTIASLAIMTPVTVWLWKALPLLRAIQFPWRFNTVMAVATTALAALAIERLRRAWEWKKAAIAACTLLLAMGWILPTARSMGYQQRWTPTETPDYLITAWAQWTDPKLLTTAGVFEIAHRGGDKVAFVENGNAAIIDRRPRAIQLSVTSPTDAWVVVKQFYFPGWTAALANGRPLATSPSVPEGLLRIEAPAGHSEIWLKMARGPAEIAGIAISAMSAVALLLLTWRR